MCSEIRIYDYHLCSASEDGTGRDTRTVEVDAAVAVRVGGAHHRVEVLVVELLAEPLHREPQLRAVDEAISVVIEHLRATHILVLLRLPPTGYVFKQRSPIAARGLIQRADVRQMYEYYVSVRCACTVQYKQQETGAGTKCCD